MRMKMSDILEYLKTAPAGYNTEQGYFFWQFGGMTEGQHEFWLDNLIAIKKHNYSKLPADLDYDLLQTFESVDVVEAGDGCAVVGITDKRAYDGNAVEINVTKANSVFRVKLTKENGDAYTKEELGAYSELRLHVYLIKSDFTKADASFKIGATKLEQTLPWGANVLVIDVDLLLEEWAKDETLYEDGWLRIISANGKQNHTFYIDHLIGVRAAETAPTDPVTPDQPAEPTD